MKPSPASFRPHLAPAAICFVLAWAVGFVPWLHNIENTTLDARTRLRARFQPPPDPTLVVVAIDDASIEDFGRWPWERTVLASFTALASAAKTSVIAWDLLFSERDHLRPENDDKLVAGTNTARVRGTAVVFGAQTSDTAGPRGSAPLTRPLARIEGDIRHIPGDDALKPPLPLLQDRAHFGLVDTPPAPDGTRRVAPLLGRAGDEVYASLSLQSLLLHWKIAPEQVRVRLGDAIYIEAPQLKRRIPIDERGGYLVNFRFGPDEANRLPFSGLFTGLREVYVEKQPATDLPDISGRVLLVGQASTALTDNGPTPFSPNTPLVLVHANVMANILGADYARPAGAGWVLLGWVLVGFGGLTRFSQRKLFDQAAFSLAVPLAYYGLATWAWIKFSVWLPLVWPLLGFASLQVFMIARRLVVEQRAKQHIKGMFGTYLSPELVNRMIDSGETPKLGGYEENITAYFSDIQGYSSFSEKLSPERLVKLLNDYLTACTDIVQEEGGTLDKYIGDAVIAIFGAPIALPDHAYRACVATVRVQARIGELREQWTREGDVWPLGVQQMRSRIGLNTGPAIIGNMGSKARFSYTMTGDNVNLAARMESGAKKWGAYSMTTEATKLACEQHGGDRVVFRPLGRVVVVGRAQAVPIHEIVGLKETVAPATFECLALFAQALTLCQAGDWDRALAGFEESAKLEPNVPGQSPGILGNPSLVYLDLVCGYKTNPPPKGWDGVVRMNEK